MINQNYLQIWNSIETFNPGFAAACGASMDTCTNQEIRNFIRNTMVEKIWIDLITGTITYLQDSEGMYTFLKGRVIRKKKYGVADHRSIF